MRQTQGELAALRTLPQLSRPEPARQQPHPSLLDEVEQAMCSAETAPVRFAEPVRAQDVLQRSAEPRRELARPIRSRWRKLFRVINYGMLASMIGYGGFLGYNIWYGPVGTASVSAQEASLSQSETVVEMPVSKQAVQSYQVAGSQPKRLQIAGLDVHARITAQGMTQEAQLLGAKNSNDIAWYKGSASPGRSGVSVMVGTLAGPKKPSNFAQAGNTAVGDKITVTMGDDSAAFYRVTSVTTVPAIDDMSAFLSQGVGTETLKLVLRDKTTKTADAGHANIIITAQGFQDPEIPALKRNYYSRW